MTAYAALIVTYPITLVVFYLIGKRCQSGYITGGNLLATYGGALVGEILGQTITGILSSSFPSFNIPLSFTIAPGNSLSFLFVALCGFVLSNLSRADAGPSSPGRGPLVVSLVALAFGAEGSLDLAEITLNGGSISPVQFGLLSLVLFPVELFVFYYLGRRYPITGRTFRYFGQSFVGLYIGSVCGAVLAVALFGQSSWSLAPGQGSLSFSNGVVYQNVAPSLRALLESLNPLGSLPILPFFAMSLSRTASKALNPEGEHGSGADASSPDTHV